MRIEYVAADVDPRRVRPQSFSDEDVLNSMEHTHAFGQPAVFLESLDTTDVNYSLEVAALVPSMKQLALEALARAADFDDTQRYAGQWLACVNDEQQRASLLAADS